MQDYLAQAGAVLEAGYDKINGPQGLLIALAATIFLRSWKQWIPAAFIATLIYVAIEHFREVLRDGNGLALPDFMAAGFWSQTGVLLVGFLVVIGILFFAKRIVMTAMAGAGGAKQRH